MSSIGTGVCYFECKKVTVILILSGFIYLQYDLSASQFSPDGRVFQIEYAGKAAEISGTAVALRGKDGCVIAVEKIIGSKLHEPDSGRRIFTIEQTIGVVNKIFF